MNLCREHGMPSRDQRRGAKDGACARCPSQPPRKRRHSEPRKETKEHTEPEMYYS